MAKTMQDAIAGGTYKSGKTDGYISDQGRHDSSTYKSIGTDIKTKLNPQPVQPVTPTVSTDYGSVSTGSSNYYNDLLGLFKTQNESARAQAIAAIEKGLQAAKGAYDLQKNNTEDEYNKLIDQNEVAKERARIMAKEAQANRGQLGSPLGRQENLNLNVGYDANRNSLKMNKRKALDEIANLIIQAESEAEANKSNINSNFANALLQFQLANM